MGPAAGALHGAAAPGPRRELGPGPLERGGRGAAGGTGRRRRLPVPLPGPPRPCELRAWGGHPDIKGL